MAAARRRKTAAGAGEQDPTVLTLLELKQCTVQFGGLTAVSNSTCRSARTTSLGSIGPNGAGKTTVFNIITGVYQPTAGYDHFEGKTDRAD